MATQRLNQVRSALRDGQAIHVAMGAFNMTVFEDTPSIGTDGLGSCSVVLIVSAYAALLGHIPPRPANAPVDDLHAGDENVRSFMDYFTRYYLQNQQHFPSSPKSWVVCAVFLGSIALPDQQSIMETKLRDVGLNVDISRTYVVPTKKDHIGRGSVFVDTRGSTVQVYIEGMLVQEMQKPRTTTVS